MQGSKMGLLTQSMFALDLLYTLGMEKVIPRDSLQIELFVS